ncbi:fungal-specific transcription factor domain-containing protein [Bisporella sp. PMI_857]|nr:fungal-specific transcription factor domain-containing protein [Bisporella sp. PMI_857]
MACEECRKNKRKCDKVKPSCRRCRLRSLSCNYVGERLLGQKLQNMQAESLSGSTRSGQTSTSNEQHFTESAMTDVSSRTAREAIAPRNSSPYSNISTLNTSLSATQRSPTRATGSIAEPEPSPSLFQLRQSSRRPKDHVNLLDQILSGEEAVNLTNNYAAIWIKTLDGDEYTGPSSGISLFSDVGLEWIQANFDEAHESCTILKNATGEAFNHLQMLRYLPSNPWASATQRPPSKPYPSIPVTWEYVNAYFRDIQCLFPILDRSVFENHLNAYFQDPTKFGTAWSALLNAVLAAGCRAMLSAETSMAFEHSAAEGWSYFEKAIDLVVDLVYKPTNVMIVQALAVMTVYAQALSSPQRLEYTFCSIAAQVSQSLGMHRQPLPCWDLAEDEIQERNSLFWVVYILDKTIALRHGRPPVIDDDEISCTFPHGIHGNAIADRGSDVNNDRFDFLLTFVQFARLCGKIGKQLYSASALSRSSQDLLSIAATLSDDLSRWCKSIPSAIRPGAGFRSLGVPTDVPFIQALILNFNYHYGVCAIYRRFNAMFTHCEFQLRPMALPETQLIADTYCLEAARSTILLTKHLEIESYTPGWLLHYYPVTALIAIFMHVVCNPLLASVNNDIALMEVVIGLLGRLEFTTSGGVPFNKVGELVRLARLVVENARQKSDQNLLRHPPTTTAYPTQNDIFDVVSSSTSNPDQSSLSVAQSSYDHVFPSPSNTSEQLRQGAALPDIEEHTHSELHDGSALSSVMRNPPSLVRRYFHQQVIPTDSFIDSARSDTNITASFSASGMTSADAYLMDQGSPQWQMNQHGVSDQEWDLNIINYSREDIQNDSFDNSTASILGPR